MGKIPTTITSPSTPIETDARERTIAMLLAAHDSLLVTTFGSPEAAASFRAACVAFYAALSPSSPLHGVDVKSYAAACMVAARSRLVPDGDLGWIDCREGVAVWSPSWRGLLVVMHRAVAAQGGRVRQFCAEVVYRQEIAAGAFDVDLANRTIAHRPWYLLGLAEEPKETDVAICYASATLVDRVGYESREFRILTRHELDKREDATRDDSGEASDAWKRWRVSMMRSATTRAFMDWLPRNDELRIALDDGRGYRIAEGSPAAKLGGSEWTQQIPMNVAAQCTWQLLHMPEAIAVIIPVLLGAHHRLSIYTWVRDADLEAKMVHALGAWHHRHIVGKTPPEARPADHGIIASIWEAQEIELGDDPRIAELAMLDADAQKREAAAKRERQGYKVEIGSIMQHATRCSGPWGNVTWKANERVQELDHDRLVAAVDRRLAGAGRVVREAIAECTTDVSSRVLRNNYGKRTPAKKGSPSRRAT